jgi:hypothetical protein
MNYELRTKRERRSLLTSDVSACQACCICSYVSGINQCTTQDINLCKMKELMKPTEQGYEEEMIENLCRNTRDVNMDKD